MAHTLPKPQTLTTDAWFPASWATFLQLAEDPAYETGRFYYDQGVMRVEMMPIGSGHGQDNAIANQVVTLYTALKGLRVKSFINTSFRRSGLQECQPDLAFYLGSDFKTPPKTTAPVDVDEFGPPTLVIEIASTTLADDLGQKRLLYERLGIQEYWVVNVAAGEVVALAMAEVGSRQVRESTVLPGLTMATVEEALQRSQTEEDGEITRWLLQTLQSLTIATQA